MATTTADPAATAAATTTAASSTTTTTTAALLPPFGARLRGEGVRIPVRSELGSSRIVHACKQVDLPGFSGFTLAPESEPAVWKSR